MPVAKLNFGNNMTRLDISRMYGFAQNVDVVVVDVALAFSSGIIIIFGQVQESGNILRFVPQVSWGEMR